MNNLQKAKTESTNSFINKKNLEKMKQSRNYINSASRNNYNIIDFSRSNTKYGVITRWLI